MLLSHVVERSMCHALHLLAGSCYYPCKILHVSLAHAATWPKSKIELLVAFDFQKLHIWWIYLYELIYKYATSLSPRGPFCLRPFWLFCHGEFEQSEIAGTGGLHQGCPSQTTDTYYTSWYLQIRLQEPTSRAWMIVGRITNKNIEWTTSLLGISVFAGDSHESTTPVTAFQLFDVTRSSRQRHRVRSLAYPQPELVEKERESPSCGNVCSWL